MNRGRAFAIGLTLLVIYLGARGFVEAVEMLREMYR